MSWTRMYHLALRVLPVDLRLKHGAAMEALFSRELARARENGGRLRSALAGVAGVWDVVQRGVYERGRRGVGRTHEHRRRGSKHGGEGRWSVDALKQDVAHAVRSLLKAPRFTAVVVGTLALGVGANTAIFSVVDAVLLRGLPFPDAKRVVNLGWNESGYLQSGLSPVKYKYGSSPVCVRAG